MKDKTAREKIQKLADAVTLLTEYVRQEQLGRNAESRSRSKADATFARLARERYERLEERVNELELRLSGVEEVTEDDDDVLSTRLRVEAFVAAEQTTMFRYTKLNESAWESRTVSPYEIQETRKGDLLLGWDHAREDIRSFRLDRIDAVTSSPVQFRPPEE